MTRKFTVQALPEGKIGKVHTPTNMALGKFVPGKLVPGKFVPGKFVSGKFVLKTNCIIIGCIV
jgi:hypothetical protein